MNKKTFMNPEFEFNFVSVDVITESFPGIDTEIHDFSQNTTTLPKGV